MTKNFMGFLLTGSQGDLGIKLLKNIVEKYDIDISRIKSWDDLDEVFEIVRKNEPDIQVVDSVSGSLASSMLNGTG